MIVIIVKFSSLLFTTILWTFVFSPLLVSTLSTNEINLLGLVMLGHICPIRLILPFIPSLKANVAVQHSLHIQ